MDPSVKEATKQAVVVAPPLEIALNQSEQVKDKVQECADDLSLAEFFKLVVA